MPALDLVLAVLGLPVLAPAAYLFALSIAARAPSPDRDEAPAVEARLRFDVVVPAHDEAAGIAETLWSLRALDYPAALFRVLVVADNCTDATAEQAEALGAVVLVRDDPARRGKGYALAHAFERVERDAIADAVVVIDADTSVSPNLLREVARRFEEGAVAVQASYGVRNPDASWRTRLMVIALSLFHDVRSLGRERLGLSAGLRGNGMGLTREILRRVPYEAFSVVEDVEYGLKLGESGHRVRYVPEAWVLGDMAARDGASRSQRRRWEQGRRALARAYGPKLLSAAIRRRDPVLLDLAVDVIVPPLASLILATAAGAAAALALGGTPWPAVPWLASAALLSVYVLRGWALSGAGLQGLVDLLVFAPAYVVWKAALSLGRAGRRSAEWVRTARESPAEVMRR